MEQTENSIVDEISTNHEFSCDFNVKRGHRGRDHEKLEKKTDVFYERFPNRNV